MTDADALLAAIYLHPDDDTPRLVYADWLDEHDQGERAEFIRSQCEYARDFDPHEHAPRGAELRRRYQHLLKTHGGKWFAPPGCTSWPISDWCRGFVFAVTLSAADWLRAADTIAWHPTQTMACGWCEGDDVAYSPGGYHRNGGMGAPCHTCSGSGRVPRPMPATAQPIERVTLTAWGSDSAVGLAEKIHRKDGEVNGWSHPDWPGITFVLPLPLPVEFAAGDMVGRDADGNFVNMMRGAREAGERAAMGRERRFMDAFLNQPEDRG